VERFIPALELEEVVLGGGNAKKLTNMPKCCRAGSNTNAFLGGFRLWEKTRLSGEQTNKTHANKRIDKHKNKKNQRKVLT
jgi:hypothetical protein